MKSSIKPRMLLVDSLVSSEGVGVKTFGQLLTSQLLRNGYSVTATSYFRNKLLRLIDITLTIILNRKKTDALIIQVYSGLNFFITDISSLLGQLLGIPAIFHFHGGNISDFIKKHPKWSFRVLNRAKYSITPSEYLKTSLEQNGVKVTIIPNYINIEAYPFVPRTKTEPKLVWLRSFHQIYNPTLAIHTLNLLRREYPKIYLNMAGMDKGDGSLQKTQVLIHTLGLSDNINISSQIKKSEVPTFLDRGDIYLNTTNIDNTPITVLEAMACGLCIVSTNVGGISYLLEDGVDALLVPSNDVESMTSAIKLILKEPELAETLSRNARKKAELIDWSNVLPLWENLFQDVLHHK